MALGLAGLGCGSRTTMRLVGGKQGTVYDGAIPDGSPDRKLDADASSTGAGGAGGAPKDAAAGGAAGFGSGGIDGGSGGRGGSGGTAGIAPTGNSGGAAGSTTTGGQGGRVASGGNGPGGTMIGGRAGITGAAGIRGAGGVLPSGAGAGGAGDVGGMAGRATGGSGGMGSGGVGGRASGGTAGTTTIGSGGLATGAVDGGTSTGGAVGTDGAVDHGGPPLWRNSYSRFCENTADSYANVIQVWSDDRGVFLIVQDYDRSLPPSIRANTGNGWQTTYAWPNGTSMDYEGGLRGFVDGPLIAYGISHCAIQLVDSNGAVCSGAPTGSTSIAVVDASLAYSAYEDRVLRFDGSLWTQLGDPLPSNPAATTRPRARGIWADSSIIVVVANEGSVYFVDPSSGQAVLQAGLPKSDTAAVWGFGSKDIWIGNDAGALYHYDGTTWSLAPPIVEGSGLPNVRLWGSEGKLFVATATVFAEWDGSRFSVLESLTSHGMYNDLWGNSPEEVFITVNRGDDKDCGPFQVRWFDGSVVGPL